MNRKKINDYVLTFLRQGLSVLVGFLQVILLARFLGPELNGLFGTFLVYIGIFVTIFSFGLGNALIRAISNPKINISSENAKSFVLWVYIILLTLGLMTSFFQGFLYPQIIIISILVSFFNNSQCLLMADNNFSRYNFLAVISQFIIFINYLIVISLFEKYSIELLLNSLLSSQIIVIIFSYKLTFWRSMKVNNICLTEHVKVFKSIASFSLSSLITSVLFIINSKFIFVYTTSIVSGKDVGYFFLSLSIIEKVNSVISSISSVAYPTLNKDKENKSIYILRLGLTIFIISILMYLASLLIVYYLPIVVGERYDIYDVYIYFALSIPLISLLSFSHTALYSYNKHKIVMYITIINLAMSLTIVFFDFKNLTEISIFFLIVNVISSFIAVCCTLFFIRSNR